VPLGVVEGPVGFEDQLFARTAVNGVGGQAGADGALQRDAGSRGRLHYGLGDGASQLVGDLLGIVAPGLRQENNELLTAITDGEVGSPDAGQHGAGNVLQHLVPHLVPIGVVDALEVVDVGEDERDGQLGALGTTQLAQQDALQETAVGQPGERIRQQLSFGRLEEPPDEDHQPADDEGQHQGVEGL
jgi:hypothetical protein